jgi:hypothetical protein
MSRRTPTRIAPVALAALALAAPPAAARPILDPPNQSDLSTPPRVIVQTDESFDWGSAAIGAAATGALVLVAFGGFAARVRVARS